MFSWSRVLKKRNEKNLLLRNGKNCLLFREWQSIWKKDIWIPDSLIFLFSWTICDFVFLSLCWFPFQLISLLLHCFLCYFVSLCLFPDEKELTCRFIFAGDVYCFDVHIVFLTLKLSFNSTSILCFRFNSSASNLFAWLFTVGRLQNNTLQCNGISNPIASGRNIWRQKLSPVCHTIHTAS